MISQAEKQLSKVRELAERRARYQEKADAYLADMKRAGEDYRYWLSMVREADEQMRRLAAERNSH